MTSYPEGPPASKRMRADTTASACAIVALAAPEQQQQQHRTSSLPTPTLKLTGHRGSVYALKYSPSGAILCSTSFDMTCLLWSHQPDEFDETIQSYSNFNVLSGHKNAVLDCAWLNDETVVSCGADKTIMLWDVITGQRRRQYAKQHSKIVNAVDCQSPHTMVSVSDDGTCLMWDDREKRPVQTLGGAASSSSSAKYPILAVAAAPDHQVFLAGIDPKIYCWDMRRAEHAVYGMKGHADTVTSLSLHPESTHVLSNSMDKTLRTWDIRPFVPKKRHVGTFSGHAHGSERGLLKCAWSADGNLVSAGSSDYRVHIWDVATQQELYDLPGHQGCVNAVAFHPKETTVVASGSSDQQIYVGELS